MDRDVLAAMHGSLRHRGPDQEGVYVRDGVALAHRRLSIIDLSGGTQPATNETGTVFLVYNGEIYNYRPLSEELARAGHRFATRSDTEVVVHAWEEWGPACVERFVGMFAFALYDSGTGTLFLARDQIGVKPLYYALRPDGIFVFGSELKAVTADPAVPRTLDPRAVELYFALGYVPDPLSVYAAVKKLPPGHRLTVTRGGKAPLPERYWDLPRGGPHAGTEEELGEELVSRMKASVASQLVTEVPLGAFLSGGVDSGGVVAMMAGASPDPVVTCAIGFGEAEFDESAYAKRVAARYKTVHHSLGVTPDDFGLVDLLPGLYDEPFADSSALPTYRLSQLARSHVTVALSGDGGDEVFGGYGWYRTYLASERLRRFLPARFRSDVLGPLGDLYPKADTLPRFLRAKRTLEKLALDRVDGFAAGGMFTSAAERRALFSPALLSDLGGYSAFEVFRDHASRAPSDEPLALARYLDMKVYLPADVLTKVDRASMAHSLEVRVPLLDHTLVEWAYRLPPSALVSRASGGKHLLKRALERYLPRDVLYRPKAGFTVPVSRWFRGPLRGRVRDAVLGPLLADSGYFSRPALAKVVEEHERGTRDHGSLLWALLLFEGFLRGPASAGAGPSGRGRGDTR